MLGTRAWVLIKQNTCLWKFSVSFKEAEADSFSRALC